LVLFLATYYLSHHRNEQILRRFTPQDDGEENGIGNFIDVEQKAPYSRKGQFFATIRESFRKWRDSSITLLLQNKKIVIP